MLIFFCLLEESSIGPETERSTSLCLCFDNLPWTIQRTNQNKSYIHYRFVNIEESLQVRYSYKQQALDVKEFFKNLFLIMIQSKWYAVYPHLCFVFITALIVCGKFLMRCWWYPKKTCMHLACIHINIINKGVFHEWLFPTQVTQVF